MFSPALLTDFQGKSVSLDVGTQGDPLHRNRPDVAYARRSETMRSRRTFEETDSGTPRRESVR